MNTELKLFRLESETIELYYGCEIHQQKSSKEFAGYWFYFIRWIKQIHDGRSQPKSYTDMLNQSDDIGDLKDQVSEIVKGGLMDFIRPQQHPFNEEIIQVKDFNPKMHWRERYEDVILIIQSQNLTDKLKELRNASPEGPKAGFF